MASKFTSGVMAFRKKKKCWPPQAKVLKDILLGTSLIINKDSYIRKVIYGVSDATATPYFIGSSGEFGSI